MVPDHGAGFQSRRTLGASLLILGKWWPVVLENAEPFWRHDSQPSHVLALLSLNWLFVLSEPQFPHL